MLVASPLDPAATNFPVRASFVPWLDDMLVAAARAASGGMPLEAAPGERIPRPAGADALETPGGAATHANGEIAAPARAGMYFSQRGAHRLARSS